METITSINRKVNPNSLYSLERSIEWKLNKCLPWVLSHEKALYSLERSIEWKQERNQAPQEQDKILSLLAREIN